MVEPQTDTKQQIVKPAIKDLKHNFGLLIPEILGREKLQAAVWWQAIF